jgi:hypothetical protein
MTMSYIEAIGKGFPGVECHTLGDGTVYENIVWDQGLPLPSKETLDSWIASNSTSTSSKITILGFRNRFTLTEKIAIEYASIDKATDTLEDRFKSAALRALMADLISANYVDLTREDTITGVTLLETYGIIGAGRANIILTSPVTAIETPIDL